MIHLLLHVIALAPLLMILKKVSKNLRPTSRKLFFLSMITILCWDVLDIFMQSSTNPGTAMLIRLLIMLSLSAGTLFFTLTGFLLGRIKTAYGLTIGMIPTLLFVISIPYVQVQKTASGFVAGYGLMTTIWQASVLVAFLITSGILCLTKKKVDKENKRRLEWFSVGVLSLAIIGVVLSQATKYFSIPNISAPLSALSTILILKAFK